MFSNIWYTIKQWFSDRKDRQNLLRDFNSTARMAFISGKVPTLLEAKVSRGNSAYKHQFSDWFSSGFRIKVLSGKQLSKDEMVFVGSVILSDATLTRKLVVLGFDTLEVHCDVGNIGCSWALKDFLMIE